MGFGVHPPMASVLLSASVERCFVSRMWDFFWKSLKKILFTFTPITINIHIKKIHRIPVKLYVLFIMNNKTDMPGQRSLKYC